MASHTNCRSQMGESAATLTIDHDLISFDALLKTCYWFSRDFICEVTQENERLLTVQLIPKHTGSVPVANAPELFLSQAFDYALREQIATKTSDARDLLLAKAFSESGVLEDEPQGVFGDAIEEAKTDGIFKILSNH